MNRYSPINNMNFHIFICMFIVYEQEVPVYDSNVCLIKVSVNINVKLLYVLKVIMIL